jgi:transposase
MEREDTFFLDEAGCNTSMARTHARSRAGKRALAKKPAAKGTNVTMIGALGPAGMVALRAMDGPMLKADFVAFLRDDLFPRMSSGQAVVMDNLRAHHCKEVKSLAESLGILLVFIPAYSPDFNPIEHAWSKIKGALRSAAARTKAALLDAIRAASASVTAADSTGWSRHCGYPF